MCRETPFSPLFARPNSIGEINCFLRRVVLQNGYLLLSGAESRVTSGSSPKLKEGEAICRMGAKNAGKNKRAEGAQKFLDPYSAKVLWFFN